MEANKIPEQLRQFIPAVEKWGVESSDLDRYELADRIKASPVELAILRDVARTFTPQLWKIALEWTKGESLVDSHEAAKFYFFGMLLDELNLLPPGV